MLTKGVTLWQSPYALVGNCCDNVLEYWTPCARSR